jgi:hypothetical protein
VRRDLLVSNYTGEIRRCFFAIQISDAFATAGLRCPEVSARWLCFHLLSATPNLDKQRRRAQRSDTAAFGVGSNS